MVLQALCFKLELDVNQLFANKKVIIITPILIKKAFLLLNIQLQILNTLLENQDF